MSVNGYVTDLNDEEWELVKNIIPTYRRCRPRKHAARRMIDAFMYMLDSGCAWRALPKGDFPPHKSVYGQFRRWAREGIFTDLTELLLPLVRKKGGSTKRLRQLLSTRNLPQLD
jgi:putative transposase